MKLASLIALVPLAALADDAPGNISSFNGITKDGRYLVWSGQDGEMAPQQTVVQDLLTGAERVFGGDGSEAGASKFDAWQAAHPLLPLVASRTSPDKKAVADVVVGDASGAGSWVGDSWVNGSSSEWSLVIKRGATQALAAHCEPAGSVDVYWTPDGKRTLWLAHHSGHSMRDPGFDTLIVGTDGNPGVAVAMDKAKLKDADKMSATLAKAGFTMLNVTPAKKARAKSVVFAAAGHEADAKKLAAAVPGGADVQKLDWVSQVDLVLALGANAQ